MSEMERRRRDSWVTSRVALVATLETNGQGRTMVDCKGILAGFVKVLEERKGMKERFL
jgi:hypothetical protein